MLRNSSFHHLEVPCDDLELAERFYVIVFGAQVYMRRDASRRADVPASGTITECQQSGFNIDATYLKIGDVCRSGLVRRKQEHAQRDIDHVAFSIEEEDIPSLGRKLTEYKIEVIDQA